MQFSSSRPLPGTSIKHPGRALTLVFGSNGQASLIGIPSTLTAGNAGAPASGTRYPPSEPSSVSTIPNLAATLTSSSLFTPTTASISSLVSSSHGPSSTATNTDTNLPSIPTIDYPAPSPTAVSAPKDQGVGAPFYLAIVLASISFIGCVAAFIAWWIRSRARKHNLELEDPWNHQDSTHDANNPFSDKSNEVERGHTEAQTRPYYLPASIVRRSSSNLLAVPHTIPILEGSPSQNNLSRTTPDAGRFPYVRRANELPYQNLSSKLNPYQNVPLSEAASAPMRPGTERLQTGLSVQESMRTLGRLRVANRVPGDVTSGDEGGMNMPQVEDSTRVSPAANHSDPIPAGENTVQETPVHQSDRSLEGANALLEPPGPATLPWGRRIDTVAALRRTRRRTPDATVETYKNGGYWYPFPDGRPSGTTQQTPVATNRVENESLANAPPDPLGWKNTLKSSFWQAVDAVTGNRPSDLGPGAPSAGGGSGFTPAPQRVASRRSPGTFADTRIVRPQETETKFERAFLDSSAPTQDTYELGVLDVDNDALRQGDSAPPMVSHLNRDLGASKHQRHPSSFRTGSVYSTESAAARANLRKYGYTDSIPSSWSALSASRESQLDLVRTLPLPRSMRSYSPGPLSITPSQRTLGSSFRSGSASVRTRMTMYSASDVIGSDVSTLRSGKTANAASHGEVTSSVSRDGTIRSGRSTIGPGTASLESSSTTSSMLSRKKGIASKRKRPRPPPRAPSTASSVQSVESSLSIREMAVRRALLERRRKVRAAESLKR